jgi:hypothetical protein
MKQILVPNTYAAITLESESVTLRLADIQPVCLGVEPQSRLTTKIQSVQLKSGPYFNISNLFTTCYITQIT